MKKLLIILVLGMSLFSNEIILKESNCSVDKTVENIKIILKEKGLNIFTIVDHKKNANSVDMKLKASKLIIFGNPKLGTALMKQDMTVGLDLPMKILVYKDKDNKIKMAYRDGTWLSNIHTLKAPNKIKKVNNAMDKITTRAGQCKKD